MFGIIELEEITCFLQHDNDKDCIFLRLVKRGKTIFRSTITNINKSMFEPFLVKLKRAEIMEILNNEMTII